MSLLFYVELVITMITVRCKECKKELTGNSKIQFCGCLNKMGVIGDKVTAVDLGKVIMVTSNTNKKNTSHFSNDELVYQESRRQRKVRRIVFEER